MERVINLLYDIEEKANRILDRASEEKNLLHDQLQKDITKLDEEIKNNTRSKISALQDNMNQEIERERQILIESSEKHLRDLEANFKANQETLVNKIFKNIIGE